MNHSNEAPSGAGSNLAADVVLALGDGQKSFSRLLAVTKGWQSTLSAAIAGLIEDHFVERSGTAFGLTAKGCELVTRCRRQGRHRRGQGRRF
jgi:hypothetical protein